MSDSIENSSVALSAEASKQVYNIKDLPTKSVTLYTTKAHVTREIDNVLLKPGINEVEIYGLSPTVDEHSIQIEGQRNITVADMTVELVPNHDSFEDAFPEDSDVSDESESEAPDSDDEEDAVNTIKEEIKKLQLEVTQATETQNSSNDRLATWDRYAKSANVEHLTPEEVENLLSKYATDRSQIFGIHTQATQKLEGLRREIKQKEKEAIRAGKGAKKLMEKRKKQKMKENIRRDYKKAEKMKKTRYVKQERMRYWPKKVYKVTLSLDLHSLDTPGSSRRSSLDAITLDPSSGPEHQTLKTHDVESVPTSLILSYVTKEAGWGPRYDIRISSMQKTASIVYRTEFLNRTSETWKDAKLAFSTSQTSYQGLGDVVPFMHAWRVKLVPSGYMYSGNGGILSAEESKNTGVHRTGSETVNRGDLFGLDDIFIPIFQSKRPLQVQQQAPLFGSSTAVPPPSHTHAGGGLGKSPFGALPVPQPSLFSAAQPSHAQSGGLFGQASSTTAVTGPFRQPSQSQPGSLFGNPSSTTAVTGLFGRQTNTLPPPPADRSDKPVTGWIPQGLMKGNDEHGKPVVPVLDSYEVEEADSLDNPKFEETSWEDNGLTATYDVPGVRTLEPSSLNRRHKIATLNASNIHLSHICVPKLRSAAFLRTKIRNPSSSVTLLKGSAGVTLDGSFLGIMEIPQVSPGQPFSLSLGVDPGVHINYPKPTLHRSTQVSIFNVESAQVFSRSIWISNTKPQPIDIFVLDQVPVSEDEKLRIGIHTPSQLVKEGDSVQAGVSAKEGASGAVVEKDKDDAWVPATASLKKAGEINWTVKLEGGKGCLLKLVYEARLPQNGKIIQTDA